MKLLSTMSFLADPSRIVQFSPPFLYSTRVVQSAIPPLSACSSAALVNVTTSIPVAAAAIASITGNPQSHIFRVVLQSAHPSATQGTAIATAEVQGTLQAAPPPPPTQRVRHQALCWFRFL